MKYLLPFFIIIYGCSSENPSKNISEDDAFKRAKKILSSTPLIDTHNDVAWTIRNRKQAPRDIYEFDLKKNLDGDTDIPRLREGMVGGQFWSVFIPGEVEEFGYAKMQLEQIDIAHRMIELYPDDLELALTADDIINSFKRGKIASLIGIEGAHAIENSLGALRIYYRLGVRYMTLSHNVTLDWVDAVMDEPKNDGLTEFGNEVVAEMNRLGMLIDLSHVSPKAMSDVLNVTESPVIFSHSNARSLTSHARNVPDSILVRLKDNGGVVMLSFIPFFVSQEAADFIEAGDKTIKGCNTSECLEALAAESPKANVGHVVEHIEYVRDLVGIDHVGIGSDYYGSADMPIGLEDVSKYPNLFVALIQKGWPDEDLKKLAGENILRVIRTNETNAKRIQKSRRPSTKVIEDYN
tara:strand:+ start:459 stop:1682 length:1224 start_codon:yes stop_codon:yes gene_type:complete